MTGPPDLSPPGSPPLKKTVPEPGGGSLGDPPTGNTLWAGAISEIAAMMQAAGLADVAPDQSLFRDPLSTTTPDRPGGPDL